MRSLAGLMCMLSAVPALAVEVTATRYGAKGDGKADDTAALQAAYDACADEDTLCLASGKYRITRGLLWVGKVVHVRAYGATLLWRGPDQGTLLTIGGRPGKAIEGGSLHGLTIDRGGAAWAVRDDTTVGVRITNLLFWRRRHQRLRLRGRHRRGSRWCAGGLQPARRATGEELPGRSARRGARSNPGPTP